MILSCYEIFSTFKKWVILSQSSHFRKTYLAVSLMKCKKVTIGFASMKFEVGAREIFLIY